MLGLYKVPDAEKKKRWTDPFLQRVEFASLEAIKRLVRVDFRKDFWDREIGTCRSAIGQFFPSPQ